MTKPPLTDTIIVAVAKLVDDAKADRRDPSHSDLDFEIARTGLQKGDPKASGQNVGKAKRIRATLNWAIENDFAGGQDLVASIVSQVRGHGGFRDSSPNYVGAHAIANAIGAFAGEGFVLSKDGDLSAQLLESLSGADLTAALEAHVRRAKRGSQDASLLVGTGKDLLEAVAAHVLQVRFGSYPNTSNFPTLLGQAFVVLGLATPMDSASPQEPPIKAVDRAMYELACAVNRLRNKQGTGHGRPWLPNLTDAEARLATEAMGIISERLLARLKSQP